MSLYAAPYDCNNVFAKILRKEIPCTPVYDDEWALAFPDMSPCAAVHVLVIPKGQYIDLGHFIENASPKEVTGFWNAVEQVVKIQNLDDGYRIISNSGKNGGQEVPHFHVHVLGGEKLGSLKP